MHVHFKVRLFDHWHCPSPNQRFTWRNNQKKTWGLIIYIDNFTRKFIICLNMLCLLLPNGLNALNEYICRKTSYILHYEVCLFANSDGWKYCQEMFSKTSWQFVCLFMKRTFIDRYFFCKLCIQINRYSSSRHKSKIENLVAGKYIFTRTVFKNNSWNDMYYKLQLTHLR